MKVGLIDVDGHNFPNLALMRISAYHKSRGDDVEWAFPFYHYDIVYQSKVFSDEYSPDIDWTPNADKMESVMISIKPKWCVLIAEGKKTVELRKTRPKCDTPFKVYIYCTKNNKRGIWAYESAYLNGNGEVKDGSGKVIGSFVCDYIDKDFYGELADYFEIFGRVARSEQIEYAGNKPIYGWHISDLKIYDEPMDLEDFGLERAPQSWCYCEELTDDLDEWELDPCYECTGYGDDYSYDEEQDELVSNCANCPHNRRDD